MKLAISGSAGTGKTSLLKGIAEQIQYPVIEELYDDFFDHHGEFITPDSSLQRGIFTTLEAKHALETGHPKFIADRCPADLFNLWLSRGFAQNQKSTADLYRRCRSYMNKYDYIIVLPWSALPLSQIKGQQTTRKRVMNPWIQLHNHAAIIGLLQQWVPATKLLPIPYALTGITSRVEFAIACLSKKENNSSI